MSQTTTPTPSAAQTAWMELGYGMFIHFGPNTFSGVAWGDGNFPPAQFNPAKFDAAQWAGVAAEAGMKYAVLTTKHHDGFCLWPSKFTEYSVKNAAVQTDIVGAFVTACRAAGIKPGLYYSLWDRNFPAYETDDAAYAQYMRDQVRELLTNYGDVVELWFDGGWDKEYPNREWWTEPEYARTVAPDVLKGGRWQWRELYAMIHEIQPDCLVINNSSSDRPGIPRYFPIDVRTSEHYDFVWRGRVHEALTAPVFTDDAGRAVYLPLEYCTSLNPDWFYIEGKAMLHPSVACVCDWHARARATRANLLLNVGPDKNGLVPEFHRHFLKQAAKRIGLV